MRELKCKEHPDQDRFFINNYYLQQTLVDKNRVPVGGGKGVMKEVLTEITCYKCRKVIDKEVS